MAAPLRPSFVAGRWSTFVYVCGSRPLDEEEAAFLKEATHEFVDDAARLLDISSRGLHVSLSRVLELAEHEIPPLKAALEASLSTCPRFRLVLDTTKAVRLPGTVEKEEFGGFLVTPFARGALKEVVEAVDAVLRDFGHEAYFEDAPVFHASICKYSVDVALSRPEAAPAFNSRGRQTLDLGMCESVFLISGNKRFELPLMDA